MNPPKQTATLLGIASGIVAGISSLQTAQAQCVSGLGASMAQIRTQDWAPPFATRVDSTSLTLGVPPYATTVNLGNNSQLTVSNAGDVYLLNSLDHTVYTLALPETLGTRVTFDKRSMPTQISGIHFVAGALYVWDISGDLAAPLLPYHSLGVPYTRFNKITGITFDGQYLWVSDGTPGLLKVKPATATAAPVIVARVNLDPEGRNLTTVAFDGKNLWALAPQSNEVLRFDPSRGLTGHFTAPGAVSSLVFDGYYLWTATSSGDQVLKTDTESLQTTTYHTRLGVSAGMAFDGSMIWVANQSGSTLTKLRACDGDLFDAVDVKSGPTNIAYDGAHIWVTYQNSNVLSAF